MLRDLYAVYNKSLGQVEIDFRLTQVFTWTYLHQHKHLGRPSLDPPLTWFSDRFKTTQFYLLNTWINLRTDFSK